MRPLCAWLAVSGFFVAINLVAAAVMLVGGWVTLLVMPDARNQVWPFFLVGLAGVAAAILFAKWGCALIASALSRIRDRAQG